MHTEQRYCKDSSRLIEEFDRAYIKMNEHNKMHMKELSASLLKLGYGIFTDSMSLLVVNFPNDDDFVTKLDVLCQHFSFTCSILNLNKNIYPDCEGEYLVRKQKQTGTNNPFQLRTYEDYGRGARQTITAIYERIFHTIELSSSKKQDENVKNEFNPSIFK